MSFLRLIPLIRTRPAPMPKGFFDSIFRNRRDPASCVVLMGDVMMNLSDWWHGYYHRLPAGRSVHIERDPSGKVRAMSYRRK
jgi:hypothetical protein